MTILERLVGVVHPVHLFREWVYQFLFNHFQHKRSFPALRRTNHQAIVGGKKFDRH